MATISAALAIAIEHHQAGRLEVAAEIYRRVLAVEPGHPDALNLLGVVAHQAGNYEQAVDCIQRAIQLQGTSAPFHNNLGNALKESGRIAEAVASYERAVQLNPSYAAAYYNAGNALRMTGRLDEAIACHERALQLAPDFADAHFNLGNALKEKGLYAQAAACFRRALEIRPDDAGFHHNLAAGLQYQGLVAEAIRCYQRARQLRPDFAGTHSSLLLALHYRAGVTLQELAQAHAEFDSQHAAPLVHHWRPHENTRDPERRLRLGFLSSDLRRHPVGFFLIRVLENLDPCACETVCYADKVDGDDLTQRFRHAASNWHDVATLDDGQLAARIQADRIDILFDLAGHTACNRLLVFARKSAPLQIAWIGYEGTTGLSAMDYLIADRHMVPEESERYYRERVLRMPDTYLCFEPPPESLPVGPLPAANSGSVTFGSFNNLAKVGPQVIEVWAEILRSMPQSRLVMRYRGLGDELVRQRYLAEFAAFGVESSRVILLPEASRLEYLLGHQQVDLALAPFPFSGSATTCDALWMGVPVLTCPSATFASRHSLAHLSSVGLADEFAARDLSHYVELAVRWANDLDRLAQVRASLRARMAASPLCDGKRFAANLMGLLRDAWRTWVSGV